MRAALVCKTKSMEISFPYKNQLLFDGCHYDFQTDSILREWHSRYKSKLVATQSDCCWPCLCPCSSKPSKLRKLCKSAASRAKLLELCHWFWTDTFRLSSITAFGKWFPDDWRSTGSNLDPHFAFCSLTNELWMFYLLQIHQKPV